MPQRTVKHFKRFLDKKHPAFGVGKTLKGIIADWSDTQLQGLQDAVGEERANNVVKGCQVRISNLFMVNK